MVFKKAFTLAETMMVFIIIGIIASISLHTIKPWEKAYKYSYLRMYNALSITIYNHMINTVDQDAFPADADALCKVLLNYMNTSDNAQVCSGANLAPNPTSFPKDKIRLKTSNGSFIWIGAQSDKKPFVFETTKNDTKDSVRYYIVYVDLNGDRKPNTSKWTPEQMSDIVAYIVTDKFMVVPLGYPEVDSRYLIAHIVYPTLDTETGEDNSYYTGDEDIISDPITYYEAKMQAYGNNIFLGNVMTYDFNSTLPASSDFKVQDYDSHYQTAPKFDDLSCDFTGFSEPVCTVKIYDYH